MKEPKFKVGDEVNTPKNLYDETSGEVTQVEKIFQEVGDDGKFDMDGLATLEDTIQSIKLPYKFDGETLNIRIPASTIKLRHGEMRENARTRTSKFYGYAYTVTTDKMNSVFSEISLRLKKKVDEGKWKDKALTWFHTLPVIKQTDVMADAKADPGDEKFYEHLRKRYG
jgi:hypothetical protein